MSDTLSRSKCEWKEIELSEIVEFGNGKKKPDSNGDIPIYGGNGILGYSREYNYEGETIIIGRVGAYCGSVYYENKPIWVSDNALAAKAKVGNSTKFLYYFLKNANLNQHAGGSSHPLVTQTLLNSLEYEICINKSEQHAIASVLSSLDDKIDLLHRQNQTLEQMAETLFREMMSEQDLGRLQDRQDEKEKSCPSNNPDNPVQDNMEEVDDGWEEGVLGDEFDFTMGQSPPGSSYNEDGIGTPMYQGNRDFCFRFPENRVFTTEPKRFAEKYDTLISVRAPVGEQNMANEKCCIGRGVAAFRYKANPAYYSYTYFKMKSLMNEIKQFNETGTVFGSISKNDFQEMEVIIPPIEMVEKFQEEVKPIDDKIIQNCNQIRTLTALRDTLLPKLMSGELRVRV